MRRAVSMAVLAAGVFVVGSCALPPAARDSGADLNPGGRVVDADDIERSSVSTAWDALQLLGAFLRLEEDKDQRPARMTSRGRSSILLSSEPQVYLDGVRLVEYGLLHNMSAHLVERIEFVTGPQASTRYGTNSNHGVIVITTRDPSKGHAAG